MKAVRAFGLRLVVASMLALAIFWAWLGSQVDNPLGVIGCLAMVVGTLVLGWRFLVDIDKARWSAAIEREAEAMASRGGQG